VVRRDRPFEAGPVEARGRFEVAAACFALGTLGRGFISVGGLTEKAVESLLRLAGGLATSLGLETVFGLLIEVPH
jgi:hypothetical protein